MDDEDIRNIIESERQKEILEGSDPGQVLKDLGNQMGASYIMSVSAIPGVGGLTSYSVFVMDPQTAKTIARQTGTDEKEIAKSIMGQIIFPFIFRLIMMAITKSQLHHPKEGC